MPFHKLSTIKNQTSFWIIISSLILFLGCDQQNKIETTAQKPDSTTLNFDIVLLNGRVMDPETNFDAVRNVGIKDGKIVVITEKEIKGKESINASRLVVAPGFIFRPQFMLC